MQHVRLADAACHAPLAPDAHTANAEQACIAVFAIGTQINPEAVAVLLIAPPGKAPCASETRKAGSLPALHAGKECLKCLIKTLQHGLSLVRMHEPLPAWHISANDLQRLFLFAQPDRLAGPAISTDALFQSSVPQILQQDLLLPQQRFLRTAWIELVGDRSLVEHNGNIVQEIKANTSV